jgi:Fe-S cluster assembly ATP-binding protein
MSENQLSENQLEIRGLHARIAGGEEILRGIDLVIPSGEVHALMGPNGSGKSTLANTIMGNPNYEVTEGRILLNGEDVTEADPDERARAGVFMAFQYPATIPGVSVANFLRTAVNARREEPIKVKEFGSQLRANMDLLRIDPDFTRRYLNEGFSGGEKKRAEILQLAMLKPEFAVLDETDSGLDIDALRIVSDGVNALRGPEMGTLIITHYTRILNYIRPDFVHIMLDGRIVQEGGSELADKLEDEGYEFVRDEVEANAG